MPWLDYWCRSADLRRSGPGSAQYLEEMVNLFTHLKKLEEVDIQSILLSDEVVESLVVNNPNLRQLIISYSYHLTSRSIHIIAENCPQLTHIDIAQRCAVLWFQQP